MVGGSSSTTKTGRHDLAEILLKQTNKQNKQTYYSMIELTRRVPLVKQELLIHCSIFFSA
jgi:hypothetical protein